MKRLVFLLVLCVGCQQHVENPVSPERPCGTRGVSCEGGSCCWIGQMCGDGLTCPDGMCCYIGERGAAPDAGHANAPQWRAK